MRLFIKEDSLGSVSVPGPWKLEYGFLSFLISFSSDWMNYLQGKRLAK